jgi:hypothetical protein
MQTMNITGIVTTAAAWIIPLVIAIVLHEISHGWVANALGDPTAKRLGRLSVNPITHVDPVGTILLPPPLATRYARLGRYGFPVLLFLLVILPMMMPGVNLVSRLIGPPSDALIAFLLGSAGLSV